MAARSAGALLGISGGAAPWLIIERALFIKRAAPRAAPSRGIVLRGAAAPIA